MHFLINAAEQRKSIIEISDSSESKSVMDQLIHVAGDKISVMINEILIMNAELSNFTVDHFIDVLVELINCSTKVRVVRVGIFICFQLDLAQSLNPLA